MVSWVTIFMFDLFLFHFNVLWFTLMFHGLLLSSLNYIPRINQVDFYSSSIRLYFVFEFTRIPCGTTSDLHNNDMVISAVYWFTRRHTQTHLYVRHAYAIHFCIFNYNLLPECMYGNDYVTQMRKKMRMTHHLENMCTKCV